jgi:hypothetical protein
VSAGIVSTIRVKANGAMQLDRTLNFAMSSAMHFDSPATPSLVAP